MILSNLQSLFIKAMIEELNPPFKVVIIDTTDAYYYADIFDGGRMEEFDTVNEFERSKALADALFIVKNYKWNSLEEMNDCDGGFDVRVYDKDNKCVYKAHEAFKNRWFYKG